MLLLAVDPGPKRCGWVSYETSEPKERRILSGGIMRTEDMRKHIIHSPYDHLACEGITLFQTVGEDVRDTAYVCGSFEEIARIRQKPFTFVTRGQVKIFLCGRQDTIKDSQVAQALRIYFDAPTLPGNKCGGVLKGYTSHTLAALGVAVTWHYHNANGEPNAAR